eukprot:jgi/Psemu1/38635/gm1.38635_g
MEKAIQGLLKLNLQKEDLNKAYAEWMEIARTLEKDKVGRYFHVHWICRLEGMRSKRLDQTAQNEREFRASNWKQELKKDFEKSDTYDGIQKVTNPVNKNSIKSALEYIENLKYTPMTNGAEHYFEFMENLFVTLKQIDGYVTPIELRMQVAATQFCNCENEGILMYMIHTKNWVEKHISDDHRMMEQDWIDFKQHWNESLRDMYHENKRLKVKAETGDKSRELEGMVDNIWKLKFCPKKGAECYFREFDALWEETRTTCDYDVPIEICMQKATMCAILIDKLLWNVTNKANLDWWNRMGTTDRENVRDAFKIHWCLEKIKNEDETNSFFPDNEDDSNIDNNEKVNDGRDEIKAPHGWNKACKRCADKKGTGKKERKAFRVKKRNKRNSPNKKKLKKAEEASKEENKNGNRQKKELPPLIIEELLIENKIFKDGNPENLPENKIEWTGSRKKGIYKEVSSDDDSNENGKAEEDRMSVKEGDQSQEERSIHRKEEDKKNEEEAASERDPIEDATDPALQLGDTDNIEEKAAKATDTSENNEWEEKQKTWKDYLPMEEEDKKKEKEVANYTAQIAVARNPTLQEDNTDKNQEAAANDTDPIAVAADQQLGDTIRQQSAVEDLDREGTVGSNPGDAYAGWTEYAIRCTIHASSHWSKGNNMLWGILFKLVGSGPSWSYIQSYKTQGGVRGDGRKAFFALYFQACEEANIKLIIETTRQFIQESIYKGDSKHYNFDRHKCLWHDAKQTLLRHNTFPPEDQFVYDFCHSLHDIWLEHSVPIVITEGSEYYANFEKALAYLTCTLGRGRNVSAFTNNRKKKNCNKNSTSSPSSKAKGNNTNNGNGKKTKGTYNGPVECKFYPRKVLMSMSQDHHQQVQALKQAKNASLCELDSHADTAAAGSNMVLLDPLDSITAFADVAPFSDAYSPMKDTDLTEAVTYIFVFGQALYFGNSLQHSLICSNQIRDCSLNVVEDTPKHYNSSSRHSLIFWSNTFELMVPLQADGVISYFHTRGPTKRELDTCDHVLAMDTHTWNPYASHFVEDEEAANASFPQVVAALSGGGPMCETEPWIHSTDNPQDEPIGVKHNEYQLSYLQKICTTRTQLLGYNQQDIANWLQLAYVGSTGDEENSENL